MKKLWGLLVRDFLQAGCLPVTQPAVSEHCRKSTSSLVNILKLTEVGGKDIP